MVAWIGALVPLAVAVVTSLQWPTLRRRIRDHAALVKDLSAEVAGPLTQLLSAELDELVRREKRRLDGRLARLLTASRIFGALGVVAGLGAASTSAFQFFKYDGQLAAVPEAAKDWVYAQAALGVLSLAVTAIIDRRIHRDARDRTDGVPVGDIVERARHEAERWRRHGS